MDSNSPAQEPIVEYEAPAIIYEGQLTTRAGTPNGIMATVSILACSSAGK
jgi:hypothetical protein